MTKQFVIEGVYTTRGVYQLLDHIATVPELRVAMFKSKGKWPNKIMLPGFWAEDTQERNGPAVDKAVADFIDSNCLINFNANITEHLASYDELKATGKSSPEFKESLSIDFKLYPGFYMPEEDINVSFLVLPKYLSIISVAANDKQPELHSTVVYGSALRPGAKIETVEEKLEAAIYNFITTQPQTPPV